MERQSMKARKGVSSVKPSSSHKSQGITWQEKAAVLSALEDEAADRERQAHELRAAIIVLQRSGEAPAQDPTD